VEARGAEVLHIAAKSGYSSSGYADGISNGRFLLFPGGSATLIVPLRLAAHLRCPRLPEANLFGRPILWYAKHAADTVASALLARWNLGK